MADQVEPHLRIKDCVELEKKIGEMYALINNGVRNNHFPAVVVGVVRLKKTLADICEKYGTDFSEFEGTLTIEAASQKCRELGILPPEPERPPGFDWKRG